MECGLRTLTPAGERPRVDGPSPLTIQDRAAGFVKWFDVECYLLCETCKGKHFRTVIHVQASSKDCAETMAAEQYYHGLLMKVRAKVV